MKTNIDKAINCLKSFKMDDNSEYLIQAKEYIDSVLNKRKTLVGKVAEGKNEEVNNLTYKVLSRNEAVMNYLHNTNLKVYQVDFKDQCVTEIYDLLISDLEDVDNQIYIIKQGDK